MPTKMDWLNSEKMRHRNEQALEPIVWTGDLSDDCTAVWAGLMLRAEWMDEDWWWWSVYDMERDEIAIDSSNDYDERFIGGEIAMAKAECVARAYIKRISQPPRARFLITDTFKITGRGLVFAGEIIEGLISPGDFIEFIDGSRILFRKIKGVEGIRRPQPDLGKTGLLISCNSDAEIDYLRGINFSNQVAIIYHSEWASE